MPVAGVLRAFQGSPPYRAKEGNMDGLDDFLKGDEQPVAETPAEPEPQAAEAEVPEAVAEEPKGPVRDEKGRFAPKGEEMDASPASEKANIPESALIGERRRRQEAEDRLKALEDRLARIDQPQQVQQPTVQGPPDRWEDPEGYDRWLIGQAAEQARAEAVQAVQMQRIEASAIRARAKYEDYAEAHSVFGEMIQKTPGLFEQMMQAEDPAEFAYKQAKTEIELRQYGGIDALVDARVKAALATAQPVTPVPAIPETLADAQSARGSAVTFTPPSLDEILRR